ncbi:glycine hydroxymethyltransferase [Waddlia chondrophila]|uniref:Serine hydroxymethyltransferase n=1 Tax=Waddlia chondrophila (strain ATCC VR-1470 / WSU 86-1044) TaxID=716544 RepID=D6YRW1_WADCW|nr:glycine hydroxymethyltransferase [Waddlia chondrophila]ADI38806.1 serine hydroxymethyltransferase [Waddlia chondrophila WSU 86-1044]
MTYLSAYLEKIPKTEQNSGAISFLAALDHLETHSPAVAASIKKELEDQRTHLKLIASENYSSLAVQQAMGNFLTDKYAEGYVNHRFYAGCENVDSVEEQAQEKLKKIFNCDCAYVQPHSGADANLVAFWSILVHKVQNKEIERLGKKTLDELTPEEYEQARQLMMNQKMLGMSLNAGGHLTHGYIHNVSSKMMQAHTYDVDPDTELLDYQKLAQQAKEVRPVILLAGYSAYPRLLNFAKLREIADSIGSTLMVDMAHFAGLVAGKQLKGEYDPVPYADLITSTTHKTLRGPRGGLILCKKEYEEVIRKGCPLVLGGPLPHVMAAKAVAFNEANTPEFQAYAKQVIDNARAMANALQSRGVRLVTGGTENHLVIVDLSSFGLTGRHAETALRRAGITINRNAIPFDKNGPWYTTGIRLGTPALTTLGMKESEMKEISNLIVDILENTRPSTVEKTGALSKAKSETDPKVFDRVRSKVSDLLKGHPLYPEIVLEKS